MGGRKHPRDEFIKFDTTNVLFICAGAFSGLSKSSKKYVGFNNLTPCVEPTDVVKLEKYGIIPEILGRLPVIVELEELSKEELKLILTKPKGAIVNQYQSLFKIDGVELNFTDDALDEIATEAYKKKLGARSLRKIMEDLMTDIVFNLERDGQKKELLIELTHVRNKELILKHLNRLYIDEKDIRQKYPDYFA
jgi:ATP-dependent Clp protease ATP-binding subunit ClpX